MQLNGNMPHCGQWRLVREIGHGAYGVVYLAVGSDGKRAAVKVCRREEIGEERYARELRGARLYSAIPRTAGLVCMKELVEEPWGFYSVMDLADHEFDGETSEDTYRPKTLASILGGVKALSLDESVKLGIALAKGLETLQRHHLLHRDIKPGNVIYVGGRPVLSDPGLVVEESEAASLVGTPGYVPPENFTAAVGDVYSLGLTLKAASFGRSIEDLDKGPALEADTSAAQFPAWWRILNKATDPTPSRRYQSAKALLKDLEGLRRKIAFASIVGSSVAKGAIALCVLAVIAIMAFSVFSRERTKDVLGWRHMETMVARSERETMWPFYLMNRANDYTKNRFKRMIESIAETNQTLAVNMRSRLAAIEELDKRDKALLNRIQVLYQAAEGKVKNGLDDEEEYLQAKKLYSERRKISEEITSISKVLFGK
jgi:serine/threonine protein kinase